eukprot:TRINITY_DN10379_c0_g1_i1.p1 TRINITY_DN10379_c0_g1~~TRINITY_DN10379_c0_g1_i1.p1  ORF type:complete len:181 (+),score=61.65 TRINITY_DN10379_c0_g1_i1:199-741(+)
MSAHEAQQLLWQTGCEYGNFLRFPQMEQQRLNGVEEVVLGMLSRLDQFGAVCDTLQFDTSRTADMVPRMLENASKMQSTFEAIDALAAHVQHMAAVQGQLLASVESSEVENNCESVGSKISNFFSRKKVDSAPFEMSSIPESSLVFAQMRANASPVSPHTRTGGAEEEEEAPVAALPTDF